MADAKRRSPGTPLARGDKLAELLAREIVRDIAQRRLEPGTPLAAEAEMVREFGVGRSSVREALRLLEVQGIISIRPGWGGGPVVAEASTRSFGRTATAFMQLRHATFEQLMEARLALDPLMARLAAEHGDPEVLRILELQVKELSEHIRSGSEEPLDESRWVNTSTSFHDLVARASRNEILNLFGGALKDIYTDRITGVEFPHEGRKNLLRVHRDIGAAILRGEGKRAERLMRDHMVAFVDLVREQRAGLMDEVVDWR
ncbi:MAG TPA: FCD domain-containing protein [Candidatus Dormibacteraeota bacterium]|nr:FCD domain-containing protein [Candidatus Dormibacteraeota bacterium]